MANEYKVPTKIAYPKGSSTPSTWGFAAESRSDSRQDDKVYREWFKRLLDPAVLRQAQAKDPQLRDTPRTQEEVDKWFEDFMRFLYRHIESRLSAEFPSTKTWQSAKIEFIFSVPTTWRKSFSSGNANRTRSGWTQLDMLKLRNEFEDGLCSALFLTSLNFRSETNVG
jgi:hypothetical protein